MIDIKSTFRQYGIVFVEDGPNTKKGELSIACPLCKDDPSQHLGINPDNGYWACWRNKSHRGRNLAKLFKILGIPFLDEKADTLKKLLDKTMFSKEMQQELKSETKKFTSFPIDFMNITGDSIFDKSYLNYLKKRGFDSPVKVAKEYHLMRCVAAGKWSTRLIIPIYIGDEVSWTGRAIGFNELRYLSPTENEAKAIKETIWNYNELKPRLGINNQALVICEGPLDAIKLDWYTKKWGIRATCIFGLMATDAQLSLLNTVCQQFHHIFIGLDQGTLVQSLTLIKQLRKFNPIALQLGKKDFGEMTPEEMKELLEVYCEI